MPFTLIFCLFGFHPFKRHGIYRICPRCHKAEPALDHIAEAVARSKQTLDEISFKLGNLDVIAEELKILNKTAERIYMEQ